MRWLWVGTVPAQTSICARGTALEHKCLTQTTNRSKPNSKFDHKLMVSADTYPAATHTRRLISPSSRNLSQTDRCHFHFILSYGRKKRSCVVCRSSGVRVCWNSSP